MVGMDKSLIDLARKGIIDPDVAIRQSKNQKKVAEQLGRAGTVQGA